MIMKEAMKWQCILQANKNMPKIKIAKLNNLLDIVNTILIIGILAAGVILALSLF